MNGRSDCLPLVSRSQSGTTLGKATVSRPWFSALGIQIFTKFIQAWNDVFRTLAQPGVKLPDRDFSDVFPLCRHTNRRETIFINHARNG